jgi:hypothetical protein
MRSWIIAGAGMLIAATACSGASAQSDSAAPAAGRHGALREACMADVQKLCVGAEPGGGHIMQCLRGHQDQLSDTCKTALSTARANHQWRHDNAAPAAGAPQG